MYFEQTKIFMSRGLNNEWLLGYAARLMQGE
jgi:hypothetical protein